MEKPKALELFSGSKSFGKVAVTLGYEVISVDITDYDGLSVPTHKVDIMDFDYKQYDKFDVIWASPPCINYSTMKYSHYGRTIKGELFTKEVHEKKMKESDELVKKTLEIIDYFKPRLWFIENPKGLLKGRGLIDVKPYLVSYCKYCDWGYKKPTNIWTNKKDFVPKYCSKSNPCDHVVDGYHKKSIQAQRINGKLNYDNKMKDPGQSINIYLERAKIPPKLIEELLVS